VPDSSVDAMIEVSDLRKRYGKVVALDGLSFEVPARSVTGLLGPNGSGKTTTISILSTSLLPDAGQASVCGLDVVSKARAVRGLIGFAGQFAAVDESLTGRENLWLIGRLSRLSRSAARNRAVELLDKFALADAGSRLVRTYSGGMRRRLDIAAALMHRPPVLFLDEPTTGLDPESRRQLWDLLRGLVRDGATVLLTTQYLEDADALADELVIIDRGRVVERGTPHTLRRRIGSAVLEFTFGGEPDAIRAAEALAGRYPVERHGLTVQVSDSDGSAAVVGIARALEGVAPDPVAVEIREPTLDDVFLSLTGKSVPDSASDSRQATTPVSARTGGSPS
jgi:ABC-2 type transport system ATP-binding protein